MIGRDPDIGIGQKQPHLFLCSGNSNGSGCTSRFGHSHIAVRIADDCDPRAFDRQLAACQLYHIGKRLAPLYQIRANACGEIMADTQPFQMLDGGVRLIRRYDSKRNVVAAALLQK
ncbi:hypothetical protein D3C81_1977760 [compost metagenome]